MFQNDRGGPCSTPNVLNASELFTLKWLCFCRVIFPSINTAKIRGAQGLLRPVSPLTPTPWARPSGVKG